MTHRKGSSAKVLGIVRALDYYTEKEYNKLPWAFSAESKGEEGRAWVVASWNEYSDGETTTRENVRTIALAVKKEHAIKLYNELKADYENL
jgi:hypothetical protein